MRYQFFLIGLLLLTAKAQAQETTVWFTILGRGGVEEVEIGPEGGLVPYRLWMETDPIGTPGNFGIRSFQIMIETNLGTAQSALEQELPPFLGGRLGAAVEDDLLLAAAPLCRTGPCNCVRTGVGQSRPQAIARGHLLVAPGPIGTQFVARVVTDPHTEATPKARILTALFPGSTTCARDSKAPDRVVGNTLTIRVVVRPKPPADFDRDGDVDLADYLRFLETFACEGGPTVFGCDAGDLDWDGDVDLADAIAFQSEFTGSR